ncbi:hypothetical protein EIN_085090 [Entamoeba invadens IP1]|uniref:hypothetical protein n=1 Tax=Entamoeba invadens IP1 TaxID=370355 RepID=UPI0002C3F97F|nr:hypothetical protein EIN_085090 [Entamoeba invadens IP1]ELP85297.1 hypothetical protein EIN_085090 [Entamoeba invadens IP1]|eukprot:XP_004184643.1 hypothetical protein EIN_085090 [Entamoeba invadens IP1]
MLVLWLVILNVLSIDCESLKVNTFYDVEAAFSCIDSVIIDADKATRMLADITAIFETYVYKDILHAPPEIEGHPNYYQKVDIDAMLKKIDTSEQPVYTFYQNIQNVFAATHDLHLSFRLTSDKNNTYYFDNFYATLPFYFDIINEGKSVVLFPSTQIKPYGGVIPDEIIANENVPITSINDLDPLAYIRNFAESYTFLKSSFGRFTYAMETLQFKKLSSTPLDIDYLKTPIKIVFSNGNTANVNYQMLYAPVSSLSKAAQNIVREKEQGKTVEPIMVSDIFGKLKRDDKAFDFESADGNLACKTYTEQDKTTINVIVLKTFYPQSQVDNFYATFNSCIAQIDNNNGPIAMILPMNGGGYGDLESNIENLLAPFEDTNLIGSVRISPGAEFCVKHEYGAGMYDPETCKIRYDIDSNDTIGDWYTEPVVNWYQGYSHIRSQVSLLVPENMLAARFVKNPRNPDQVMLFSDGYCYSACALLTKGMFERGSAINVGYEGDPEGDVSAFDCGQSPTAVIGMDEMGLQEGDELATYGGFMRTSFYEYFKFNLHYNEEVIPREFTLSPVDERIHIYKYSEDKLPEFVDAARTIYEKYQTQCNPNNKLLTKYSKDCDSVITIEHAHGGYICGDDGKWSQTCRAAYCDVGYKFDMFNSVCVKDACDKEQSSSVSSEDSGLEDWAIALIFLSCVVVIAIILALIVIVAIYLTKKKEKVPYEPVE